MRQSNQKGCFYYGGPEAQRRVFESDKVPPFHVLIKNRVLMERRFYLNSSNAKSLTMGIVPGSKILGEDAPGFYLEIYLNGEKCAPLPLGGEKGLVTLLSTIRSIPEFSKIPPIPYDVEKGENILIHTVDFADDVSISILLFVFILLFIHTHFVRCLFYLQVYKIQNSDEEDVKKAIFLKADGIYEIIKNERLILAAAKSFNVTDIETSFNQIVSNAVSDYNSFCAEIHINPSELEIELLTNFVHFFEVCIDIKKKEKLSAVATTAATAGANNNKRKPEGEKSSVAASAATTAGIESELPRNKKPRN